MGRKRDETRRDKTRRNAQYSRDNDIDPILYDDPDATRSSGHACQAVSERGITLRFTAYCTQYHFQLFTFEYCRRFQGFVPHRLFLYSMRTRWRKRILSILPLHPPSSSRIEMRHRTARSSTLLASACLALPLMINGASNAATSQQSPLEACNTIRQRTEASSMSHQPQYQGNCAITANERRAIVRERMTV